MAIQPFSWGAGGQKLSPSQVKKYSDIAAALAARSGAPKTLGEGLNRVGEALVAKSYEGRSAAGEAEGAKSRGKVLEALMANPDPSMADLMGAMGNEWVTADPGSSAVVQALLGREMQQSDPMYQLGLEKAGLEIEALRTPPAPDAPTLKTIYDPETGREQVVQWNGADWVPVGGVQAPKDPLVQVNTGDGAPGLGKLSTDYGYVLDPATGQPRIDPDTGLPTAAPVPGSPAALEAEAAAAELAAQEGAQIASDIEGAEKTLFSTRNVLELLDNSGGQPTTGTLSRPFAMLSNTPAGRIRSYVSTLQSGVALGAMQRLKEASATGATGFGSLSAPELNLLISDIGALDPDNTEPEIFRATVQRIEDRAKRVVADIRRNVSPERIEELGLSEFLDAFDPPGETAPTDTAPPSESFLSDPTIINHSSGFPPEVLWQNLTPEQRALWP